MRKKFRLGLNGNSEEILTEELQEEFNSVFEEIKKEIKKMKLLRITKDLELAEKHKDQTALKFLRGEFEKVLAE
jgi:hypothetical protein